MSKRTLVIGLSVSVALHVIAGVILRLTAPSEPSLPDPGSPLLVDFDIHQPPAPPEAEMPGPSDPEMEDVPDTAAADSDELPQVEPEVADVAGVEPEPDIADVEPVAAPHIEIDAGIPDAVALAALDHDGGPDTHQASGELDAAVADAAGAVAATLDAGVFDDAAVRVASSDAGPGMDAAAVAATGMDAGAVAATGMDAGAVAATGMDAGAAAPAASASTPGVAANLLAYLPPGEVVTALVRLDRLRGTPWAAGAAAILAPMPDHRTLVGERNVAIADLFHTLVISSPRPEEVAATTLVGRTHMSGREVRQFLNHPGARVAWSAARGGAVGRRLPSPRMVPHDRRVFLMPFPGWVALAHPSHLGALVEPAQDDIDAVAAAPGDLPPWLARIRAIEAEAGTDAGPALIITAAGLLPPTYRAPYVGEIVTPQRLTVALEMADQGFYARGTLVFADTQQARHFMATAERARRSIVDTRLGRAMLSRVHAYNALRGLSLKQNQNRVGFATSISVADSRALMDQAVLWSRSYFASPPAPAPAPTPAPAAPTPTPAPAPAAPAPDDSAAPSPSPEPAEVGTEPADTGPPAQRVD